MSRWDRKKLRQRREYLRGQFVRQQKEVFHRSILLTSTGAQKQQGGSIIAHREAVRRLAGGAISCPSRGRRPSVLINWRPTYCIENTAKTFSL